MTVENKKLTVEETKAFILMMLHAYAEVEALAEMEKSLANEIDKIDLVKRKIEKPELLQEPKLKLTPTDYRYHYKNTENGFLEALVDLVLDCMDAGPFIFICLLTGAIFASIFFLGFMPLLIVGGILIIGTIIGEIFHRKEALQHQKWAKNNNKINKREHPEKVESIRKENELRKYRYEQSLKIEEERVNRAKEEKRILTTHKISINKRLDVASDLLNKLKGMNVIHSKYSNPTSLAIIWDLLDTGRTKSLTIDGADQGAYNLLETYEFREKLLQTINVGFRSIVLALEDLKYKLNVISDQNSRLLSLVKKSNQEMRELRLTTSEHSKIVMKNNQEVLENTKLTAYNTKKIQENTDAMFALDLFSKRMKGEIAPNTLISQFKNKENLNMYL